MKHVALLLTVDALVLAACAKPTPGSGESPLPTYTPYPTYTSVPAALPTDTPMAAVPAGWRTYETLSGNMTFAYPESWKVKSERVDGVSLTSGLRLVDVTCLSDATVVPSDDEQAIQLLLSSAASSYENDFSWKNFQVVDRGGVWDASSIGRVYYCEILAYNIQVGGDDVPVSQRWVLLLLDDRQKQVLLCYGNVGTSQLTDTERGMLRILVGTVRVQ